MQNNQQSGNQQKPVQPLSWSQPAAPQKTNTAQTNSTPASRPATAPKKEVPAMSATTKIVIAFVIGFIIGWFATWSWFSAHKADTASGTKQDTSGLSIVQTQSGSSATSGQPQTGSSPALTDSSTVTSPEPQTSTATVLVPGEQQAGKSVSVSSITGEPSLWAVVYENDNGGLGRVLGAARFTSDRTSGTIELMRTTLPNLTYFVVLAADTPDHTFNFKVNAPLVDAAGKQILTQFIAK